MLRTLHQISQGHQRRVVSFRTPQCYSCINHFVEGSNVTAKAASCCRAASTTSSTMELVNRSLPYGLQRINYNVIPPITNETKPLWPLPPPPPHLYNPNNSIFRSSIQPILAPICVAVFLTCTVYLIFNPEVEIYEYWKQVEQGNVPLDSNKLIGDDEDDDDDDDDEWDDE
jgi:hypothetical protein